jgi:hypothetical protein
VPCAATSIPAHDLDELQDLGLRTDDLAEQSQQRRDRGDRSQGIRKSLELRHDPTASLLDAFLHQLPMRACVDYAGGQNAAQRQSISLSLDMVLRPLALIAKLQNLRDQISWA